MKANMRTMRTIGKWAFTIAAAVVAILCAQKGNGVGVIWPIIAAILHWIATGFQELCDELVEEIDAIAEIHSATFSACSDALAKKESELAEKVAKIAELEEEIIKLKQ